jgi:hypothetical protein
LQKTLFFFLIHYLTKIVAFHLSKEYRYGATGMYSVAIYNLEAQQFILDNLDDALETKRQAKVKKSQPVGTLDPRPGQHPNGVIPKQCSCLPDCPFSLPQPQCHQSPHTPVRARRRIRLVIEMIDRLKSVGEDHFPFPIVLPSYNPIALPRTIEAQKSLSLCPAEPKGFSVLYSIFYRDGLSSGRKPVNQGLHKLQIP